MIFIGFGMGLFLKYGLEMADNICIIETQKEKEEPDDYLEHPR